MEEKVELKVGKELLKGAMYLPQGKGPFPGVVFFHGLGSSRVRYLPMAQALAKKGIIALVFDFRGCGESEGVSPYDQTPRMIIDDGKKILDFLLSQNVDRKRIGIQGTSFGGYVALILVQDYNFIKSIVLRAPAALSDKDIDVNMGSKIRGYFIKKENWIDSSSYNDLSNFRGHLLVLRSEKDELIPEEVVNKYYDVAVNAKERKLYVQKNAGHELNNNPIGLQEFYKRTIDWFLKTL